MLFLVHIALAQTTSNIKNNPVIKSITAKIADAIVAPIIEGIFVLAVLIFIWGVFGLIKNADDPKAREEGQKHVLWGVIGMVIMLSVYGIIRVIANTLGLTDPFA